MKMTDKLVEAFNRQISMELASALEYLQMWAHFDSENLTGMASWMSQQSDEENMHARQFLHFVINRGNKVRLASLEAPTADYESVEQVFETALRQEREVTEAIHELYRLATEEGDLASLPFLQSFIEEQNEEEAMVETILERVRLAGGESSAILLLDGELGARNRNA